MVNKKKVAQAMGQGAAETAARVGHKPGDGAAVWGETHEVGLNTEGPGQQTPGQLGAIRDHMEVFASCGARIGRVDKVEGDTIKLARNDSQAGGQHHFIPRGWVESVDQSVHLNRNAEDAMREWHTEPTGAI